MNAIDHPAISPKYVTFARANLRLFGCASHDNAQVPNFVIYMSVFWLTVFG